MVMLGVMVAFEYPDSGWWMMLNLFMWCVVVLKCVGGLGVWWLRLMWEYSAIRVLCACLDDMFVCVLESYHSCSYDERGGGGVC